MPNRSKRAALVAGFSRLGEHGAVWLCIGAAGATAADSSESRRRWRSATGSVIVAYAANTALKLIVRRPRPPRSDQLTSTPTQLSFPSAHAATSFAAARAFTRVGAPPLPLYVLAVGLAASRRYLGVHHSSDLVAGAVLGTVVGSCWAVDP